MKRKGKERRKSSPGHGGTPKSKRNPSKLERNIQKITPPVSFKAENPVLPLAAGPSDSPKPKLAVSPDVLKPQIIAALKTIFDPEVPVNIFDLGLIYKIDVDDAAHVKIQMTLTTPDCPVGESIPHAVLNKVKAIPGVTSVEIDLVWDPPWEPAMMAEAARLELDFL